MQNMASHQVYYLASEIFLYELCIKQLSAQRYSYATGSQKGFTMVYPAGNKGGVGHVHMGARNLKLSLLGFPSR